MTHNEYLASDVWKCTDSPTGAHHWIEIQYTDGHLHTGLFYCKWCQDAKNFPVEYRVYYSLWDSSIKELAELEAV